MRKRIKQKKKRKPGEAGLPYPLLYGNSRRKRQELHLRGVDGPYDPAVVRHDIGKGEFMYYKVAERVLTA